MKFIFEVQQKDEYDKNLKLYENYSLKLVSVFPDKTIGGIEPIYTTIDSMFSDDEALYTFIKSNQDDYRLPSGCRITEKEKNNLATTSAVMYIKDRAALNRLKSNFPDLQILDNLM